LAWEASEWVGRTTPADTAWAACATALPAIVCLWLLTQSHARSHWPFTRYADAYAIGAGTPIAMMLGVWFLAANILSPGDISPLPYVPLVNPLELTLGLTLVAVILWARQFARVSERMLYSVLGGGIFIAL